MTEKRHQYATPYIATAPARPAPRMQGRSVGSFVPKITRPAFEKFGFSTAALLTDWSKIVGATLAETTVPDRIRWPRAAGVDTGDSMVSRARPGASASGQRPGATLHLRVEPARALDVQYQTAQIIDRINAYFGYRAVADLRILQAPVAPVRSGHLPVALRHGQRPPLPAPRDAPPVIEDIADAGLRAALERLSAAVHARSGAAR